MGKSISDESILYICVFGFLIIFVLTISQCVQKVNEHSTELYKLDKQIELAQLTNKQINKKENK